MMALELLRAFPKTLSGRFQKEILDHGLKKEILASQLANGMVDYMGITYVIHLLEFVGSSVEVAARAHLSFAEAFGLRSWCDAIEAQAVSEEIKLDLLVQVMRLGRRATRWIVRHRRELSDVRDFIECFQPRVKELIDKRELLMSASDNADWRAAVSQLRSSGVSEDLAKRSAKASRLADSLPIIDASDATGASAVHAAEVFVSLSDRLGTDWLAEQLASLAPASHWQSMERDALLDDVMSQQGLLAADVLTHADGDVDSYLSDRAQLAADWRQTILDAQQGPQQDFSMYAMTCRKLIDLQRVH
jgi:glutamate dehydrogenase